MIDAMAEPLPKPWTLDDFLAWEEQQPERYEFVHSAVRLPELDLQLPLDAIYDGVPV